MAHFQQILALQPLSFTYLAIGSNPHANTVEEIDDFWDQLMPVFVREKLHKEHIRCIHIDPGFERNLDFLKRYYATKYPFLNYSPPDDTKVYHSWTSSMLQVIVFSAYVDHDTDYAFFESMSNSVLSVGGKMVVQEFTGGCLKKTLENAYTKTRFPIQFKKNILFDITYGDASCMTDMSKTKPLCDAKGNFVNFTLLSADEMLGIWGISSELDIHVKNFFIKKFKTVLNEHDVNYRRRTMGDGCLFKKQAYNDSSSPEFIMDILQKDLQTMFKVFENMGLIDTEKQKTIDTLMKNYKEYDMYDWYTRVNKLFI